MVIDIITLLFLAYGFWVGYTKGIISTVLTLASYVIGLLAAMRLGPIAADMLYEAFPALTTGGTFLLGAVLVFFLTLGLFKILAKGMTGFLEKININIVNQVAGGLLSGLFFVFIWSGLVYFGDRARIITEDIRTGSVTYKPLSQIRLAIWERGQDLYPIFSDFYDKGADALDRLRENVDRKENNDVFDLEE